MTARSVRAVHGTGELVECPWLPGRPPGWPCRTPAAPSPVPRARERTASLQEATEWPAGGAGLQTEPAGRGGPGREAAVPSAAGGGRRWRSGGMEGAPSRRTGCTPAEGPLRTGSPDPPSRRRCSLQQSSQFHCSPGSAHCQKCS